MGFLFRFVILPVILAVGGYHLYKFLNPPQKIDFPKDGWFGAGPKRADDTKISPFTVDVPQAVLDDLKNRLQHSRYGHEVLEDSDNFEYGFNLNYLKKVQEYWQTKYDWRKQEAILNSWPQFTTEIEGIKVHYYHVKPDAKKYKKIIPVLVVHGWPGNVFEFYKFIPILTDPASHKVGTTDFAFEVIAPSIPGYGFSAQPKKTGFSQVAAARVFHKLLDRLGHKKYFLQGGDWGSIIVTNFARMFPENVIGMHVNMLMNMVQTPKSAFYNFIGSFFPKTFFAEEHHQSFSFFSTFATIIKESGYMHIQATKPDTVGTALNDSPIGLAAYVLEKFSTWTNYEYRKLPDGGLTKKFTMDELLTIISIYWTQGNIVSSQRFYKEFFLEYTNFQFSGQYLSVPTQHAQFKNELFDKEPFEILSEGFNLTQSVQPDGGHFAAFEEPKLLATDVFAFARRLTKK